MNRSHHFSITALAVPKTTTIQNNKEHVPQMYRGKHLSITAWAYTELQNNKECVPQMYRCKQFSITTWAHANYKMTKYVCLRSINANI